MCYIYIYLLDLPSNSIEVPESQATFDFDESLDGLFFVK